jgi:hypothetical protein
MEPAAQKRISSFPVILPNNVKPTQPHRWMIHILLSLNDFDCENNLMRHVNLVDNFVGPGFCMMILSIMPKHITMANATLKPLTRQSITIAWRHIVFPFPGPPTMIRPCCWISVHCWYIFNIFAAQCNTHTFPYMIQCIDAMLTMADIPNLTKHQLWHRLYFPRFLA